MFTVPVNIEKRYIEHGEEREGTAHHLLLDWDVSGCKMNDWTQFFQSLVFPFPSQGSTQMLLPDWMSDCLAVVSCFNWLLCLKRFMSINIKRGEKFTEPSSQEAGVFDGVIIWAPANIVIILGKMMGWTGASCCEPSLPGQTGYQRVAFWDGAGKAQTVWCASLGACSPTLAQFPHLPSLTHLLTVWTVSSRRRHYIFFPFSAFWHLFVGIP